MAKKRFSPIWKMPEDEFRSLVANNKTKLNILKYFGLRGRGASYKTLNERISELNIDISHLERPFVSMVRVMKGQKLPLEKVMVKNSSYSRHTLKRRILEEKLLENRCSECGLEPIWQGKQLTMVLDHINGIPNDHRLQNLRFLCPNCNSQTDTFSGKNINRKRHNCIDCGKEITKKSKRCKRCFYKHNRKVELPSKEQLIKDIENLSWCAIGRKYGVTDNAVRKWAQSYGILKPRIA